MQPASKPLDRIRSTVQASELQAISHQAAKAIAQSLSRAKSLKSRTLYARALRDAVSAWDTARDAVRILKGKGLPTRVPEKLARRRASTNAYQILDAEELPANVKQLMAPKPETKPEGKPETGKPGQELETEAEPKKESL